MKIQNSSKLITIIFFFHLLIVNSNAEPTTTYQQHNTTNDNYYILNLAQQLIHHYMAYQPTLSLSLSLSSPLVVSGLLCFAAASISSAGGVGGGGLFIPIMTIAAGFDLKTASSLSAFMVTGASVANVVTNLGSALPRFGGSTLIDFDIALLSQPGILLGVSAGVVCNVVFPEWLVTALFAVFLAWSTAKTFRNGSACWRAETEGIRVRKECLELENGVADALEREALLAKSENADHSSNSTTATATAAGLPWVKLGVLILVWCSFCFLYLLRGNRYGEGITTIEPCGVAYWLLSSFQIPLAIVYTAWILYRKESSHNHNKLSHKDVLVEKANDARTSKFMFPLMALLAGGLGGLFGIGGGMLISPLLLQVGIGPEITSATCSFMVFFSSTMSAFQYLLLGMENVDVALILALVCFVASVIGLVVVQKAVQLYGRASLIVFSVGLVMALSTVLMTAYGVIDVYKNFTSGKYMGFKLPC